MSTNGGPLNPSKRGLNGHNTLLLLSSWAQKTLSSNPFGPMDPWLRTYELDYFPFGPMDPWLRTYELDYF